MNKDMNKKEENKSIRGQILVLSPGETIRFALSEAKVSYLRHLASEIKMDYGMVYTVHADRSTSGATITRTI